MKKLIALLVFVGLVFVVWHFNKKNHTTPKSRGIAEILATKENRLVPAPYLLNHEFVTVGDRMWKDKMEAIHTVNNVFEFLLKARGAPEVSTEQDEEIWSLVEQYHRQTKVFRYGLISPDKPPVGFAAMYDCRPQAYWIGNNYMTTAELGLALYHEIRHEVDCAKAIAKGADPEDMAYWASQRCNFEENGYAAGVRLMLALKRLGLLPSEIHGEMGRQNFMEVNVEVWSAISQARFCEWYKELFQAIRRGPPSSK